MAGEYSRELSTKVFAGQCRMIENGFRQGGSAGFGLRRVLIDQAGNIKGTLNPGEQKNIQTDRVILLPGPEDEIRLVNSIFRWLIDEDLSISQMIARLNKMDVRTDLGRRWTFSTVREVLTNEKYIGNNIYNRRSFKLKKLQVKNPPAMWIRKEAAFEGIVPPEIFLAAQQVLNARATKYTDEELLERLRLVYQKRGRLSSFIIDQSPELPGYDAVTRRFGSLAHAYDLIGFRPKTDLHYFEINRKLRRRHPEIVARTQQTIADLGGNLWRDPATDLLHLNQELIISLVLARCRIMPSGVKRWRVRFDPTKLAADITLAIRLDPTNEAELDYFLLPRLHFQFGRIHLKEQNVPEYECFRFTTLDFFYGLARRIDVRAALRARRSMNGAASIAA
jgi:hypothetical protein